MARSSRSQGRCRFLARYPQGSGRDSRERFHAKRRGYARLHPRIDPRPIGPRRRSRHVLVYPMVLSRRVSRETPYRQAKATRTCVFSPGYGAPSGRQQAQPTDVPFHGKPRLRREATTDRQRRNTSSTGNTPLNHPVSRGTRSTGSRAGSLGGPA